MSPALLIRADAGPGVGSGHVVRCLALAAPWIRAGQRVKLASAALPAALRQQALAAGVECVDLKSIPGSEEDAALTSECARSSGITHCVVDGYRFSPDYVARLRPDIPSLLVCDDFGHLSNADWDFLLNPNLKAGLPPYRRSHTGGILLAGPRFALLRPEFMAVSRVPASLRAGSGPAGHLLVLAGGADAVGLSDKCLDAVGLMEARPERVTLVVGGSHPRTSSLKARALALGVQTEVDVRNMAALMNSADVALSAGGSTLWELCCLGVPALAVIVADNQRGVVEPLAELGAVVSAGWHGAVEAASLSRQVTQLCHDPARRRAVSQAARRLVDGQGATRVWLAQQADRIHLRDAIPGDCLKVFDWANDPIARAASFAPETIDWNDHQQWFAARIASAGDALWVAETEGMATGVVRFEPLQDCVRISINLAPECRGRGLGALVLWSACRKWFSSVSGSIVLAQIRPGNAASIAAFEKVGFERVGEETVKGVVAARYELRPADFES